MTVTKVQNSRFSTFYLGLMAAVSALAAAVGQALDGEWGADLPSGVEPALLVGAAVLLLVAGSLPGRTAGAARVLAVTGLVVVATVLFLTLRDGGSSAAILEAGSVVIALLFLTQLRRTA